MTVDECVTECEAHGYLRAGLTGGPHSTGSQYFCYCGCTLNTAAPKLDASKCNSACNPPGAQNCGGNGVMSAFRAKCTPEPPPSAICGNGSALPAGPACSQQVAKRWAFCDTSLPLEARVKDLVRRISLPEMGPLLTARQSPAIRRLGIPPFYWGTNAIHGIARVSSTCVGKRCATTFPQALNIASTFNRSLMRGVGRTVGREMRAFANLNLSADGLTSWAPTVNIIRDPRWGRNQETASEDPLVAGVYGAEWALGMQYNRSDVDGDAPPPAQASSGELMAVATLKHLLGYSLDKWSPDGNWSRDVYNRNRFDARISPLDLESTYSQPFKRAIEHGGAAGIMYACNKVNGLPSVASPMLRDMLSSWGFDGYRTTDGNGIHNMNAPTHQNYTASPEESIARAMLDGHADIDDGGTFAAHLADAYAAQLVNLSDVRRALANTFRIRFRLGLFDPSMGPTASPYLRLGVDAVNDEEAQQVNRDLARQSLVLLQNGVEADGMPTLPLRLPLRDGKVVVVGGSANSTSLLGGSYARSLANVDGYATGGFPSIPVALKAMLEERGTAAQVEYYPGMKCILRHPPPSVSQICDRPHPNATLLSEAVGAVRSASHVIVVLNLQALSPCDKEGPVDGEYNPCGYEAEEHDRFSLELPRVQQAMAEAVLNATSAAGVPTAVVLIHGGSLSIERIKATGVAILDAHYPGAATGASAVVDTLYGFNNPSGKLTYSVMPAAFANMSNFASMDMSAPPGRGYRYYPTSPELPPVLWPFGWGLSYTDFEIGLCSAALAIAKSAVTVQCTLSNVGSVHGAEVVQLYHVPSAHAANVTHAPVPHRLLIDFERYEVPSGAQVPVHFSVHFSQLQLVTATGGRVLVGKTQALLVSRGHGREVPVPVSLDGERYAL